MRRASKGFTLIEAIVSVALVSTAVAASVGALGGLSKTEWLARHRETMERLAVQKSDELIATGALESSGALSGDFSEQGETRFTWSAEILATGIENLDTLDVTIHAAQSGLAEVRVQRLFFVPSQTLEAGL